MNEDRRDPADGEDEERQSAPQEAEHPGAGKMESLERIERSVERQSDNTTDREEGSDARRGESADGE